MLSGLVLACQVESGLDSGRSETIELPAINPIPSLPEWSPDEVAEAWNHALSQGWPNPADATRAYLAFMAQGDESCPGDPLQLSDEVILGCTANSGYYFSGIAVYRLESYEDEQGSEGIEGIHGDFRLETPVGEQMWVGGTGGQQWSFSNAEAIWYEVIEGTWIWEGGEGPYVDGVSGLVATTISRTSEADRVVVNGALSFGGIALSAEDFAVDEAGCASGTLAIRDPATGWHEIAFSDCSGRATVLHESGESGEAHFELGSIFALAEARLGPR